RQRRLRAREGALGVDEPAGLLRRRQKCREGFGVGEMRMLAEEVELAGVVRGGELLQHQPPEQLGEHLYGEEEVGPGCDPALPIRRQTATWYNHVHVRVMRHGRAPGVQ